MADTTTTEAPGTETGAETETQGSNHESRAIDGLVRRKGRGE